MREKLRKRTGLLAVTGVISPFGGRISETGKGDPQTGRLFQLRADADLYKRSGRRAQISSAYP